MQQYPAPIHPASLLSPRADELPPHIRFGEYQQIRVAVLDSWMRRNPTPKSEFYRTRDLLFIDMLWATGARVDDLCQLPIKAIQFEKRQIRIPMKKSKRPTIVTVDSDLLLDVNRFISDYHIRGVLFGFSRIQAYKMIKKYAGKAGLDDVYPHKFRHGLAVYLLQQGVPIPVISARLGHASIYVTMSLYMKVTPEIQAEMVKHVLWR